MKLRILSLIVLAIFSTSSALADITLQFGVYTSDKATTMVKMFRPILKVLESQLSTQLEQPVHIKLKVASSYEQGIADLVNGRVDFSRMGPASYVLSKQQNSNLQLLAMESKKGKKVFYGIIAVPLDSELKSIGQLKNKRFAFGDKRSTIGRYLSQYLLSTNGVNAGDLSHYEYLGRHDRVGTAVGAGQYDAGALKESTFKKLVAKGVKIRELASFPNVTKPWIASASLSPEVTAVLTQALLSIDQPETLKNGFLAAEDSDYSQIRESINLNAAFFK
jgi:phosphonate transport system substrate-binding protein